MTEISFRDNFFRSGYLVLIGLQLQTKSIILLSHTIISNRKWTKSSFFESITEIKRTPKCLKNFMGATTFNSIYVENGASSWLYSWTPHFNLDDPVPRIPRSVFHIWVEKVGGKGSIKSFFKSTCTSSLSWFPFTAVGRNLQFIQDVSCNKQRTIVVPSFYLFLVLCNSTC